MYTTTYSTKIENILKMFQKVSYTHQNWTSSKTDKKKFCTQSTRTEKMRNSFSRSGVQNYNSLPLFSKSIKQKVIQIGIKESAPWHLESEDFYTEGS